MEVRVREARPGDEAAIVRLVRELDGSSPITADYVQGYLATPGSHVLLAEGGEGAIGLLSYSVRPDLCHASPTALIEALVVHGGARGQGVGSALMVELQSRLAAIACVELSASTEPDNHGAQRFYRAHGLLEEVVSLEKHF